MLKNVLHAFAFELTAEIFKVKELASLVSLTQFVKTDKALVNFTFAEHHFSNISNIILLLVF